MSALVFLAIVFASILAISVIIALMIWDSEQETLVETIFETFLAIVHFGGAVVGIVSFAVAVLLLLWETRI